MRGPTAEQAWTAVNGMYGEYGAAYLGALLRSGKFPDRLAPITGGVWGSIPHPEEVLTVEVWHRLFGLAGYCVNTRARSRPVEPVRLYRGATDDRARGLAWTSDRAIAASYAADGHAMTFDPCRGPAGSGRRWSSRTGSTAASRRRPSQST